MDVRPILTGLLCAMTVPAAAAPFVAGEPQTLSSKIAESRAAVIVRAIDGEASWQVECVLQDRTGSVEVGERLQPRPAPPDKATQALLLSNRDRSVESVPLSAKSTAYLRSLPAADAKPEVRLAFARQHLTDADSLIAGDAFAILAGLNAAEFEEHRELLSRQQLGDLIEDSNTPGDRVGLYGYLVGLCGNTDDAKRLRLRLFSKEGFGTGAEGIATGYLLLAGEEGLTDLESNVLMKPHTPPLLAAAVLDAIGYLRLHPEGAFTAQRLQQAACCGLVRKDIADLAIGQLASSRSWSALPDVAAVLTAEDSHTDRGRAGQVAATRFLLECRRDGDAPTALRSAASRLLDDIAASDADLIRRATHLSGEPPRRH